VGISTSRITIYSPQLVRLIPSSRRQRMWWRNCNFRTRQCKLNLHILYGDI